MMTKKIACKAVLLAFTAFLLAFAYTGTARAYDLYELFNLAENGDFSNGTALWVTTGLSSITTPDDGYIHYTSGVAQDNVPYSSTSNPRIDGHIYYISAWCKGNGYVRLSYGSVYGYTSPPYGLQHISYLDTPSSSGSMIVGFRSNVTNQTGMLFGNVIVVDLTAQFGSGLEPSLSDFETLYLPSDQDYFETYQSFGVWPYTQLPLSGYTDLVSDLTGIDYKKSIIDTYGENIDVSIYAYFFDTPSLAGDVLAQYYYTLNNPEISWRSTSYTLDWSFSEYSDRVLYLDLTDEQMTILKRALFDRSVGTDWDADYTDDSGYFKLDVEGTAVDNVKLYIVFSSVFDLRVDVESFLISYDTDIHNNTFLINQEMYIKCQDKYDQMMLPALFSQMGEHGTKVINDFGSAFTDVLSFNFEFEFTSPEPTDDSIVQTFYLYELGAFSASDVVIGNYDPTLPLPFDPQVCDWYELGCQAKNGANDFVAWFYEAFDIEAITASVTEIFDSFDLVISLMPDEIVVILAIVGSALVAILIIVIVDRVTGGRSG